MLLSFKQEDIAISRNIRAINMNWITIIIGSEPCISPSVLDITNVVAMGLSSSG